VVCPRAISPNYQPAPKDAGFHVVQALLLLTRHLPLKEALVSLTTIPKGILLIQKVERKVTAIKLPNSAIE